MKNDRRALAGIEDELRSPETAAIGANGRDVRRVLIAAAGEPRASGGGIRLAKNLGHPGDGTVHVVGIGLAIRNELARLAVIEAGNATEHRRAGGVHVDQTLYPDTAQVAFDL